MTNSDDIDELEDDNEMDENLKSGYEEYFSLAPNLFESVPATYGRWAAMTSN
jgi:hypothetical protein